MTEDFHAHAARLAARQEVRAAGAPRGRDSSRWLRHRVRLVPLLVGVLWGFLFGTAVAFANANYEQMKVDVVAHPEIRTFVICLGAFLVLTPFLFGLGVLRRLMFRQFRQRVGWWMIIGFCVGQAFSAATLKMVPVVGMMRQ